MREQPGNRGQGRNRTGDLSLFRRTLLPTELPGLCFGDESITNYATPTGLEPATSAVTGRRANQLRHGAFVAQGTHPSGRPRNYSAAGAASGKWAKLRASARQAAGVGHAMVAVLVRVPIV
jgi:hypothetical protein